MIGQMMNYKKYYESLEHTPEPDVIAHPMVIDYKGLIHYARQKGVQPCDLSESEKERFVIQSVESALG